MYHYLEENNSPNPIKKIQTQPISFPGFAYNEDEITVEQIVLAMNKAKSILEGVSGICDVKFRLTYGDESPLEAYGYRLETQEEADYRIFNQSYVKEHRAKEYFRLKAERQEWGLPL